MRLFLATIVGSCMLLGCGSPKAAFYIDRANYVIHATPRSRLGDIEIYEVASKDFPNLSTVQGISTYPHLFRDSVPVNYYINRCHWNRVYRNFKAVELSELPQTESAAKHMIDSLARSYPDKFTTELSVLNDTAIFYAFPRGAEYPSMDGLPLDQLIKPEHVYEICYHKEQAYDVVMSMRIVFETDHSKSIIFWTEQKSIIKVIRPTASNL
jgi:hypothetical protein